MCCLVDKTDNRVAPRQRDTTGDDNRYKCGPAKGITGGSLCNSDRHFSAADRV